MLKGQTNTEVELSGGVMYFVIIMMMLITILLAPLIIVYDTMFSSEARINAAEFANLAKVRMISGIGNAQGEIIYSNIGKLGELGLGELGLARNYLDMESIVTGEHTIFKGSSGSVSYDRQQGITCRWNQKAMS